MKTILSFLGQVSRWLCSMWGAAHVTWLFNKFDFFPTDENLFVSLWYTHAYYRWLSPERTVYDFLDSRVQLLDANIANLRRNQRARQLEGYLLKALYNERIRLIIVEFLESKEPEGKCQLVLDAMRSAWRIGEWDKHEVTVEVDKGIPKRIGEDMVERPQAEEDERRVDVEDELVVEGTGRPLYAKTYVIAVQLCYELDGRGLDFDAELMNMNKLIKFIRERFGVERLPGTFEKFKGYSYKKILKDRSGAKKGQLKVPFRQVRDHPDIFGEAVATKAGEIYDEFLA